ncbi:MAG: RNA polymerase sigma factor [Verrucomicrobiaceae bacterium]|nr:RNA polymerase sigma factor [Verrucomicrobiaceae bacterium]
MSPTEHEPQPSGDWKNCFRELAPRLVLYARQFVDSIADAEDVVQMAFVRWWHRHPDGDRSQVPLLYAAVRSISIDMRRKDMRRILREAKSDVFVENEDAPWFDSSVEQRERAQIVADAMRCLPEEQREVVTLHLWGGLTFAQIAEMTGVSINTVAGRYRYALAALGRKLEPRREDLGEAVVAPAL